MKTQLKRSHSFSVGGLWGDEPDGGADDIAVVRVADFDYARLTVKPEVPTLRKVPAGQRASRLLRPGDIMLEKSGGGEKQNVGRAVGWSGSHPAICSNFINLLRPAPDQCPQFLVYLHRSLYIGGTAAACTKQTTGIQNLEVSAYLRAQVQLPGRDRQQLIAEFLDRECARISELRLTALRGQAQLVAPALDRASREFDRWPLGRLSYAFEVQLGKMLDQANIDPSDTSPYLRNANVHWNSVRLDDLKRMTFSAADRARFALRPGDLLVCEGGEPGRAAVWPGSNAGEPVYYQKALHRLRPICGASPRYAMWMLRILSERSTFAVDGPGRYTHLTAETLRAVRIPMPEAEQQHSAAAEIDALDTRTSAASLALEGLSDRLSEYQDALITEAVTGQLDVARLSAMQLDESVQAAREGERPAVVSA